MGVDWRSDRRSVIEDLPEWPGWPAFMKYYEAADDAPYPEDSRLYFVTIFEIGCRESEAILLKPTQFRWNDEALYVRSVPVDKKKRRVKTGRFLPTGQPEMVSIKKKHSRDVLIKIEDNPLATELVEMVKSCDTDYLMPARKRRSREIIPDRHTTRGTVYNRITEIHPDIWPHGVRGYRASHLVHERGFTVRDLVKWFEWEGADMALHYTRTKDIAKAMGIQEIPR